MFLFQYDVNWKNFFRDILTVYSCFQGGCLQLINAILSNADDLEFRLHLRNEIMRAGLIDVLEVNAVEQYEYISVLFNMFLSV